MTNLVNIDGRVTDRILKFIHEVARRQVTGGASELRPRVTASEAVARGEDELLSPNATNAVNRSLVTKAQHYTAFRGFQRVNRPDCFSE